MTEWIKDIRPEDLPEQYHEMVAVIGLENTLKLAERFNKQGFYFTGLDKLIERKKKRYIIENFNGSNHKDLARATGYSERWVYEILKEDMESKQPRLW